MEYTIILEKEKEGKIVCEILISVNYPFLNFVGFRCRPQNLILMSCIVLWRLLIIWIFKLINQKLYRGY